MSSYNTSRGPSPREIRNARKRGNDLGYASEAGGYDGPMGFYRLIRDNNRTRHFKKHESAEQRERREAYARRQQMVRDADGRAAGQSSFRRTTSWADYYRCLEVYGDSCTLPPATRARSWSEYHACIERHGAGACLPPLTPETNTSKILRWFKK